MCEWTFFFSIFMFPFFLHQDGRGLCDDPFCFQGLSFCTLFWEVGFIICVLGLVLPQIATVETFFYGIEGRCVFVRNRRSVCVVWLSQTKNNNNNKMLFLFIDTRVVLFNFFF